MKFKYNSTRSYENKSYEDVFHFRTFLEYLDNLGNESLGQFIEYSLLNTNAVIELWH